MNENNKIPEMKSYDEMAEFWDAHSVAEHWNQTEPVEFDVSPDLKERYLVAVDFDILNRIRNAAHNRGIDTESLVNLLLEQRLNELR